MTTLNDIINKLDYLLVKEIQEGLDCECECLFKKDKNYWLNNTSVDGKRQIIGTYIANLHIVNEILVDTLKDTNEELKEMTELFEYGFDKNKRLEEELQKFKTPPPYVKKQTRFRPQTKIGGCEGCEMWCEDCESLVIDTDEEDEDDEEEDEDDEVEGEIILVGRK